MFPLYMCMCSPSTNGAIIVDYNYLTQLQPNKHDACLLKELR